MMKLKVGPTLLITLLIVIIVFLVGIRYGQNVEKMNKKIDFVLSIRPTKAITPSPLPTITYLTYEHKKCGFSFLYPSYLHKEKDSSESASFVSGTDEKLSIHCSNDLKPTPIPDVKIATESVELGNKELLAQKKTVTIHDQKHEVLTFSLLNLSKKIRFDVTIDKNLMPIFAQSFTFLP